MNPSSEPIKHNSSFLTTDCPICQEYGEENCTPRICEDGRLLLEIIYRQSGMPKSLQRVTMDSLTTTNTDSFEYRHTLAGLRNYAEGIEKYVPGGYGLFLYPVTTKANPLGTGTGKSTAAAAIMNKWFIRQVWNFKLRSLGTWVSVPEWLMALKAGFDGAEVPEHLTFESLVSVPLVVLDDLGSEKPTEWAAERVYSVLNRRTMDGLATIVTSNFTIEQLAHKVGYRIASRLEALARMEMTSEDHRRKGGAW